MKIVLGIHPAHDANPLVGVVKGLAWPSAEVHVVAVVESVAVATPYAFGDASMPAQVYSQIEAATEEAARKVAAEFSSAQVATPAGDPATELTDYAKAHNADLIVVGSERKGFFGSLFFGSVSRGLTLHGDRSLLLVKQPAADWETMVFATDLSDYSQHVWQEFVAQRPGCLRKLHVVTAVDVQPPNPHWLLPNLGDYMSIPEPNVEEIQRQLAERFPAAALAGVEVVHEVVMTDAKAGLEREADARGAGVLIVGGKGHTWADRVFIGSVALHHTVHGEQNLWVVRPAVSKG